MLNKVGKAFNIILCLCYAAGYLLMQLVVFYFGRMLGRLYYTLTMPGVNDAVYSQAVKMFLTDNSMLFSIVSSILCIMIAKCIRKYYTHEDAIEYNDMSFKTIFFMELLSVGLYFGANIIISLLFSELMQGQYNETMNAIFETKNKVTLILAVGLIGPIAEEYIFRGEIYSRLSRFYGENVALIAQGILFGVLHYEGTIVQITYAVLLGIILGIIRKKSRGISAPTLVHIVFNSMNFLLLF